MKYLALLRGINVGCKILIRMNELKTAVESCGFRNVRTYIQSGNVLFEEENMPTARIADILENCFLMTFRNRIPVIVLDQPALTKVMDHVPAEWKKPNDLRMYIAFVKSPVKPEDVVNSVKLNKDVDSMKAGPGVLYMSTKLSGLTKSGFTKLVGTDIYKLISFRSYGTIKENTGRNGVILLH